MMLVMRLPLAWLALVEGERGPTTLLMLSPYAWLAFVAGKGEAADAGDALALGVARLCGEQGRGG